MEDIRIAMIRDNLEGLPSYSIPPGFHIRNFRRGEERKWAEVCSSAGEFESIDTALAQFENEFGQRLDEMENRCFFVVEDATERIVGTAIAWIDPNFQGEDYGHVHWVAINPEFQGRKLAKPLMSAVMQRLKKSHTKAYLRTHTTCLKAINMYLDFGFVPLFVSDSCDRAWRLLADKLKHPALIIHRKVTRNET